MAKTTKNLPARVEEYTALQAKATFTKAEAAAYKELADYINKHIKENVLWYWDLGVKIAKIYKAAQADQKLYGKSLLPRLAMGLGYKTDRQLRNAMRTVDLWKTKKAFMQYIKLRGESGNMLQWSHIVHLSKIGDDEVRLQLAANTLDQCWTADELWARVKALAKGKTRGGGRPPKTKIPATARGCLTHMKSQALKFIENYDKAWTGDSFNILEKVKEMPADKLNDDLLDEIKDAREKLADMAKRANDYTDVLAQTESNITRRIEAQAAYEEELEEEDEDLEDDVEYEEEDDEVEYADEEDEPEDEDLEEELDEELEDEDDEEYEEYEEDDEEEYEDDEEDEEPVARKARRKTSKRVGVK